MPARNPPIPIFIRPRKEPHERLGYESSARPSGRALRISFVLERYGLCARTFRESEGGREGESEIGPLGENQENLGNENARVHSEGWE